MKAIPGYEGYFVTEEGEIYKGQRKLNINAKSSGYLVFNACTRQVNKVLAVHRVVLLTFVGECPDGMEACHLDGDRTNNRLENLRWDTRQKNRYDTLRHTRHNTQKLTEQDVTDIRWMLSTKRFTQKEIGQMFGVTRTHVGKINRGEVWSHTQTKE